MYRLHFRMKRPHILIFLLLYCLPLFAREGSKQQVVLLGNTYGNPNMARAIRNTLSLDSKTLIVFLGNDMSRQAEEDATDTFRNIFAGMGAQTIFLPGPDEWKYDIETDTTLLPANGCPGPKVVDVGKNARLVLMNSEWWLQGADRPGMESGCGCKNEMQILDKLADIISDNRDKLIIFAAHHSFHSTGIHSGYFGPRQHIFPLTDIRGLRNAYLPLPGLGAVYPVIRAVAISKQDMAHNRYAHMIKSLDAVLEDNPFVIRVGGHEHLLELYGNKGQYYITSGAGDKAGRAVKTRHTPFVGHHKGFAVLEIDDDKTARVAFYEMKGEEAKKSYSQKLLDFRALPPIRPAKETMPVP